MPKKEWHGWHFLSEDRRLRWGTKKIVKVGQTIKVAPPLELCFHGLHASVKARDALTYAPGPVACRVRLSGEILQDVDKACATERTVLAMGDATMVLHEFACWCAERTLKRERAAGREPNQRSWEVIRVKRLWMQGKATDAELGAAQDAAWDAAQDAELGAAQDAAWDAARDAAWDAARAAAWDAALAAAWAAVWDAAWGAAWGAEAKAQNRKLTKMLNTLLKEQKCVK